MNRLVVLYTILYAYVSVQQISKSTKKVVEELGFMQLKDIDEFILAGVYFIKFSSRPYLNDVLRKLFRNSKLTGDKELKILIVHNEEFAPSVQAPQIRYNV